MKQTMFIVLCILLLASSSQAGFHADNITGRYSWRYFKIPYLDCKVDVRGLFYETTIEFEFGLTKDYDGDPPPTGNFEIHWDFTLPEQAVVTACGMKAGDDDGDFIPAAIVDVTTAEQLHEQSSYSQPRLLLRNRHYRQYDGSIYKQFYMTFYPVSHDQTQMIRIRYLTPCTAAYNARRIELPLSIVSNVRERCVPTIHITDHDNASQKPDVLNSGNYFTSWTYSDGSWNSKIYENYGYPWAIVAMAPESDDRSYLRIVENNGNQFYQLSIAPPIPPENRQPKNILLVVDNIDEGNSYIYHKGLIRDFQSAVTLSTSSYDSIGLLYSGFIPVLYDTAFVPVTEGVIGKMFGTLLDAEVPGINTLPHILRRGVQFFNDQNKAGEIWLLTNAYAHSDPPATAMEIVSQTLGEAEHSLIFRIVSNDAYSYPRQWINGQYYRGNDYLYENLARLSWGSFVKLRDYQSYDALDAMLDCIAPAATTVEIDPEPASGLSYSRFQLNHGRLNFPITMPYYEIGLFDGSVPFNMHFYGMVDNELYSQDVTIPLQGNDEGFDEPERFWYYSYIQNLLKEPQSYETISYIEQVSVEQSLLTPYSGFIIPGPDNLAGFLRLSEDLPTAVEEPLQRNDNEPVERPASCELSAFPNPFNPETTISLSLSLPHQVQHVDIRIFNSLGQLVQHFQVPIDAMTTQLNFKWDGRDSHGLPAASGLYIVHVNAGPMTKSLKLSLIR